MLESVHTVAVGVVTLCLVRASRPIRAAPDRVISRLSCILDVFGTVYTHCLAGYRTSTEIAGLNHKHSVVHKRTRGLHSRTDGGNSNHEANRLFSAYDCMSLNNSRWGKRSLQAWLRTWRHRDMSSPHGSGVCRDHCSRRIHHDDNRTADCCTSRS